MKSLYTEFTFKKSKTKQKQAKYTLNNKVHNKNVEFCFEYIIMGQ